MNIAIVAILAAALAVAVANLVLTWRIYTMPKPATELLAEAVAGLNAATDKLKNDVSRTLVSKINDIQDFGRAQGAAAAASTIAGLNEQIATLQVQLSEAAGDPALVTELQGKIATLTDQAATLQADNTAKDKAMLSAVSQIDGAARDVRNTSDGVSSTLTAGASEEDPAGGVLDDLPARKDA